MTVIARKGCNRIPLIGLLHTFTRAAPLADSAAILSTAPRRQHRGPVFLRRRSKILAASQHVHPALSPTGGSLLTNYLYTLA
jgi:hypothetical protein